LDSCQVRDAIGPLLFFSFALMANQAADAHLPATLAAEWSLSSRDKKRLKQILALSAAIVTLLWLLYQLAQYTVAIGEEQQIKVHIDGDWKKTIHVDPGRYQTSSAGGVGEGKGVSSKSWTPSVGAPGTAEAPEGGRSNEISPSTLFNASGQNIVPSTGGTDTQQVNPGFDTGSSPFLSYGNPPISWITGGGGAGGSSQGGSGSGGNGNGSGNGGGGNPGDGPGGDPVVFPNFDSPLPIGNSGDPSGDPPGAPLADSTPGPGGGASNLNPTVQVPEPASIALYAVGLLTLLTALQGQRRSHNRLQAARTGSAGIDPDAPCGSGARSERVAHAT
jgi:uncharacterized membrane protein YgcG